MTFLAINNVGVFFFFFCFFGKDLRNQTDRLTDATVFMKDQPRGTAKKSPFLRLLSQTVLAYLFDSG